MTDIPKEALEKARSVIATHPVTCTVPESVYLDVARLIADVSEKAECIKRIAAGTEGFDAIRPIADTLILPNPEDDLLKEAREICARDAERNDKPLRYARNYRAGAWDEHETMRCTLAALKGRK